MPEKGTLGIAKRRLFGVITVILNVSVAGFVSLHPNLSRVGFRLQPRLSLTVYLTVKATTSAFHVGVCA